MNLDRQRLPFFVVAEFGGSDDEDVIDAERVARLMFPLDDIKQRARWAHDINIATAIRHGVIQ